MRSLLAFALLAPALVAQSAPTVISPAGAATGLGNSNNNIPFSWTPCSYQQVHSLSSFSSQVPVLFTQMRLRMASGFPNYAGKTVDLELFMAQSPNDHAAASAVFASNEVASTLINIVTRKNVSLPTVPNNDWAVAPFPFDNPFFWAATHVSWRANVYGNGNGNAIFTYPLDAWSGSGSNTLVGVGCKAANGTGNATHTVSVGGLGGTLTLTGNSLIAAMDPAVVTIGLSTTTWGAFTLPLDLGIIGATGCNVYNDVAATLSGVTTATGSISLPVPIPNNPLLANTTLNTQYVFLDGAANAAGLITTNTRTSKFGPVVGATRIYAISGTPPLLSGTLGLNFAMSVGFN